ncbi:hypothetical protein LG326_12635 [Metaplanococcus flavidus]
MAGFLDKFLSIEEQRKIAEYSRKAKKELNNLPLISALGDTVQGAAGLSDIQKQLKANAENPKYWLFYYEANMMYRRMNSGVNIGRVLINPIGFVAGKGVSTGLNSLDDEYEKFEPKKCLGMTIALSMNRVRDKNRVLNSEDLVILSKALAYSAETIFDKVQKNKMLINAIQYISAAIKKETNSEKQGEYFFYLSQFYAFAQNEKKMFRSLNISRKLGFKPADREIKSKLKSKLSEAGEKSLIDQFKSYTPYDNFSLTYSPDLEDRVGNTWEYVKEQQQTKFSDTGKRIGRFLERNF